MDAEKRLYNDFSSFLKSRYGEKVRRLTVNAGFGCPNREGGRSGCIYCLDGSASPVSDSSKTVEEQIREQIIIHLKKKHAKKFIAYFQAYTNTYAPPGKLESIFSQVSKFSEVVAVAIGTRPDCIDEQKLTAIRDSLADKDVWIEYGLQSVRQKTLRFIRRGHGSKIFEKAALLTKQMGFEVGAHVILGFPWETRNDIYQLARFLKKCRVDHLKIHLLHVLKGTPLEILYRKKSIALPTLKTYAQMAADLIECLPRSLVIQRLTGEGTKETHVAPLWAMNKTKVIEAINSELRKRRSYQGKFA
ncbi:MAG: TIGR01212 family radical SAM protein [Candidatus Aureabacteria bacterium]|nr:TIGR01212 family radical SAM protein [Candidatus Auribacterota bacterium]